MHTPMAAAGRSSGRRTERKKENAMKEEVEKSIEGIRLLLQGHGGDVRLVSVDEETGKIEVELQGACNGCPHAAQTLKMGVEAKLREDVPAVTEVVAV